MGLKTDLIDAKKEGLRGSGATDEAILQAEEVLEVQTQLEVDAIVNFLTQCKFRVTQFNAPVILEDFKIPSQEADIQQGVVVSEGIAVSTTGGPGSTTTPGLIKNIGALSDVLTKPMNIGKAAGGLNSSGYVYIGEDPDSQRKFNVEDEDGQRRYTSVELFREDIEDLLG